MVTNLKNANCDKNPKLELWKTQIVPKLKNTNCDKTQKLKWWQILRYDKSQFVTKDTLKGSFSKNFLTPWQVMRFSQGSFSRFLRYFYPHLGTPLALIHFLSKFIIFFFFYLTFCFFFFIIIARYRLNTTKYVIKESKKHYEVAEFNNNKNIHIVWPAPPPPEAL